VLAIVVLLAAGGGVGAVDPVVVGGSIPNTSSMMLSVLPARERQALDRALSYTPYISAGTPNRPEIALTFDDGPGPYTDGVVQALLRAGAPGTFFVVGNQVATFHDGLAEVIRAGFPIGDHTFRHPPMATLSPADQRAQVDAQAQAIAPYGVPYPRLFRPPYRSFDRQTLDILRARRMLMVLWTVDTQDYLRPGVDAIVNRALAGARAGAIILMHDAGGDRSQTVAAIPKLIARLRARGYRLVTVPHLVLDDPPSVNQPLFARPQTGGG
jgi:peptidoglycan/xylan/chitin deacetylase (PgdA/CDA1 family)